MLKGFLLIIPLALPLHGYAQQYADSPFYKRVSAVPGEAGAAGREHLHTSANGVAIDISMLEPAAFTPRLSNAWADRSTPEHLLHYFRQYDKWHAVFGYDLHVEPIPGTDQIRCTFSTLTDPVDEPPSDYPGWGSGVRRKDIPLVALSGDLSPMVVKSGEAISIATLPLGPGKTAVVQYIRLTRSDLTRSDLARDSGVSP